MRVFLPGLLLSSVPFRNGRCVDRVFYPVQFIRLLLILFVLLSFNV